MKRLVSILVGTTSIVLPATLMAQQNSENCQIL